MLKVIISAAGEGKRFYSESSAVPKPLFYYKTKPIIAHLIDDYKTISDSITVIVRGDERGNLLKAWILDYYKDPAWLRFVVQPEPIGTNDAVSRALEGAGTGPFLISWSDFILKPGEVDKIKNLTKTTFFTSAVDCRFGSIDGAVKMQQCNPGFIGIYYLQEMIEIEPQCGDFIENFLAQKIATENIECTNIGNVEEMIQNNAFEKSSARYFNEIKITDTVVEKKALTKEAKHLQAEEFAAYQAAPASIKDYVPEVMWDKKNSTLVMERIHGKPVSECKLDSKFWREDLPTLFKRLHRDAPIEVDPASCYDVYCDKPVKRKLSVQKTLDAWFGDKIIINGEDYTDQCRMAIPQDLIPKRFTFIHGDLQFNNLLRSDHGNLKIIDFRGTFGATKIYGDPAYDLSKVLYALDGYNKINENNFYINKLDSGETVFIHHSPYSIDDDVLWFFDWACQYHGISKEKLNYILMGIWMSLTGYIVDNPLAIVAAYTQAMIRSRKFLL